MIYCLWEKKVASKSFCTHVRDMEDIDVSLDAHQKYSFKWLWNYWTPFRYLNVVIGGTYWMYDFSILLDVVCVEHKVMDNEIKMMI